MIIKIAFGRDRPGMAALFVGLLKAMKTITPLACVLAIASGCATRPQEIQPLIRIAAAERPSHLYPYEYVSTVTESQVLSAPAWKRNAGHPPLSARKADELAKAVFRKLPGRSTLERTEIHLVDLGDSIHWFYVVRFDTVNEAITGLPAWAEILVLMDGTVIEPKPIENSPRKR